ncbi:hypothetical protein M3Y98_00968000 [Aphelenchoides besseyi]|nr:hypothetical protein M3Y98_00968000 [Aphelenchoides besseyi]KAI6194752.1 hypothetical protein M3Y96_01158100 [Aphelenchoides besseyi]
MHKLPNRRLEPGVGTRVGCVLDNPLIDGDVLHNIYCSQNQKVYHLTKEAYNIVTQAFNQGRRNDKHRIIDETLKLGDCIKFTHDDDLAVVDFERGQSTEELCVYQSRDVFRTRGVFNADHTQVFTETFGVVDVSPATLAELPEIPTKNVQLFCYFTYTITPDDILIPKLYHILDVDQEDQSLASTAPWNPQQGRFNCLSDDEVELEKTIEQQVGAITGQHAFITGHTSVFLPEHPHLTVLLPKYPREGNYAGREAKVDCIFNEVLNSYIVIRKDMRKYYYYQTLYSQLPSKVTAQIFVDLYVQDNKCGFFTESNFKLIADPMGFLDMTTYLGETGELSARDRHFVVPIRDRLGGLEDERQLAKLGMVTRFEIVGIGERQSQYQVIEKVKKSVEMRSGGVVLDDKRCLVYSKFFHGCTFYLPKNHGYKIGDTIAFSASRVMNPDFIRPTFQIIKHRLYKKAWVCDYKGGEFIVEASYDYDHHCFSSEYFGFIPSADVEPPAKPKNKERDRAPFYIKCLYNNCIYAQTALTAGRVVHYRQDP